MREGTMARADLLIEIVRAGAEGDQELFRKALEALITEERSKQHNILADRLAEHLNLNGKPVRPARATVVVPNGETRLYHEVRPRRGFVDLLLPALVQQACLELVEEHNRVDLLRAHNLEPRNRVLLVGPPGNGKTSLAEALAQELGSPMLVVRYESIIGSYLGETAVRLAKLFAQARSRSAVCSSSMSSTSLARSAEMCTRPVRSSALSARSYSRSINSRRMSLLSQRRTIASS
jgi:hypothetical protein